MTLNSPFNQSVAKAAAGFQKKATPPSHLRHKYVQMMNSTA